jgi:hypothetical protein
MKKIYSSILGALALTALNANAASVQDIVGTYNCTQHQLYDYYFFGATNQQWQLLDFSGSEMTVTSEGDNTVKINGFIVNEYAYEGVNYTDTYDLVGEYDETSSTITFQPQAIYTWSSGDKMMITSAGDWSWHGTTWITDDAPFTATVDENGVITFAYYAMTYNSYVYEYCQEQAIFTPVETGIKTVTADTADEAPVYYNLQGVRVANPTHGIFISKGKKIKL